MLPTIMTCSSFIRNEPSSWNSSDGFFAVYALCGLLLLCYQKWIHTPMQQIIKGASEYANGDLSYRIPVKSEDEMGYLAKTLNYMADRINQNGEYQRTFIANVSHDFRSL